MKKIASLLGFALNTILASAVFADNHTNKKQAFVDADIRGWQGSAERIKTVDQQILIT